MYSKTEVCVKIDNYRTDLFNSKLGVKQRDNLIPNLFNLYVNDLPSYFEMPNSVKGTFKIYKACI
jgi:hypothetical protein